MSNDWTVDDEGLWQCPVGDGSLTVSFYDDEIEDWPPLVAERAARQAAEDRGATLRAAIGDPDQLLQWVREANSIMLRKRVAEIVNVLGGPTSAGFKPGAGS